MLIGRDAELAALQRLLRGGVVCVVGPPGIGKSALMAAAAPSAMRIDAVGARTLDDLTQRVAAALSVPEAADPAPAILRALGTAPAILWLDGVDDGLEPLAALASTWLDLAPGLTLATTSRRPLGRPDDHVLELGPLAPHHGAALLAAAAGPRTALSPDDPELAELSAALDGLPLALVLAGERLRLLPARRLASSLDMLGGALAHSVDSALAALAPPARLAITRLASFAGGFTLEQALAVLAPGLEPLDSLQTLRDGSLLSVTADGFRLLRPIRERAALAAAPDPHAEDVALAFATSVTADLRAGRACHPDDAERALRSLSEDDLLAALDLPVVRRSLSPARRSALLRSRVTGDPPRGPVTPMLDLLLASDQLDAAAQLARSATAAPDPDLAATGWRTLAFLHVRRGERDQADAAIDAGLALRCGPAARAALLFERALLCHENEQVTAALQALAQAEQLFGDIPDPQGQARCVLRRGLVQLSAGDVAAGVPTLLQAEAALDRLGLQRLTATARWYLALVALEVGDDAGAAAHLDRAAPLYESAGDDLGLARVAGLRGVLGLLSSDLDAARAGFDEAALATEPPGRPRWSVQLLEARGILAARRGDPVAARQTLDRALALAGNLPASVRGGLARTRAVLGRQPDPNPDDERSLRARLLSALSAPASPSSRQRLRITGDARWFQKDGAPVDLSRRTAPRRILAALLTAAETEAVLDVFDIVEAGWPGERLHPDAGRARAYTAIRSLRRFGLDGVLVTRDEGYALDADIEILAAPPA